MKTEHFASVTACAILCGIFGFVLHASSSPTDFDIPKTPDGTVIAIVEALHEKHPEILWSALPPSYRKDISEITSDFAAKTDPEVYDHAFALLMRAFEVLDDQKDIIIGSQTFQESGADAAEVRAALSDTQAFTSILKGSEIATVAGLQTIDWERFLATTGAKLMAQAEAIDTGESTNPFEELVSIKAETIMIDGDRATLRISSKEHDPEDVEMVRIEDRWIPTDLADEWPEFVADARQGLAEMTPETMAAQKTQIMMFLGMAEGFIDQVAALQTPEEFDAAIGPMLAPFMGGVGTGFDDESAWETPDEGQNSE